MLYLYLKLFTDANVTPDISQGVLWESLKAFLWGHIISYGVNSKKESIHKLKQLSGSIAKVDRLYATSQSPRLYQKRIYLQTEFDIASTAKAEQLKFRHLNYEHGDKSGKLLAQQARQSLVSRQKMRIKTSSGVIVSDHHQINAAFFEFYAKLYTSES